VTEPFERVDSEVAWEGKMVQVRRERFRFADGE
jgi:hypothetical protein